MNEIKEPKNMYDPYSNEDYFDSFEEKFSIIDDEENEWHAYQMYLNKQEKDFKYNT